MPQMAFLASKCITPFSAVALLRTGGAYDAHALQSDGERHPSPYPSPLDLCSSVLLVGPPAGVSLFKFLQQCGCMLQNFRHNCTSIIQFADIEFTHSAVI